MSSSAPSQASCTLAPIEVGQSKVLRIEASYENAAPVSITASVVANETELTATDNTIAQSWSYTPPATSSSGGGGGTFSWWMLFTLAGIVVEARRAHRARLA